MGDAVPMYSGINSLYPLISLNGHYNLQLTAIPMWFKTKSTASKMAKINTLTEINYIVPQIMFFTGAKVIFKNQKSCSVHNVLSTPNILFMLQRQYFVSYQNICMYMRTQATSAFNLCQSRTMVRNGWFFSTRFTEVYIISRMKRNLAGT